MKRISVGKYNYLFDGGIVPGRTVIASGPCGVGKTTLMLHLAALSHRRVLYATGEQTAHDVVRLGRRIGAESAKIEIYADDDVDIEEVCEVAKKIGSKILFVDSIQTCRVRGARGKVGSSHMVEKAFTLLSDFASVTGIAVFALCHETKTSEPHCTAKVLHMADGVLLFDILRKGDGTSTPVRYLGWDKTRFCDQKRAMCVRLGESGVVPVANL